MTQPVNMTAVYAAFGEVDEALRARYVPELEATAERLAVDPHDLGTLMAVVAWEPQPTTARLFEIRGPYTNLAVYADRLRDAESRDLLTEVTSGGYRATERGREVCHDMLSAARLAMEPTGSFPLDDAERFAQLLRKLGEACLAAPPPPEKWCILHSNYHYPGDQAPVMERIDQWLTDLRAFRDDAHLAAWRVHGLSGPTIESLTFFWQEAADSLDSLCEALSHRGHSRDVYAAALVELQARSWLTGSENRFQLTDAGREAREQIERRTDDLFYRPWSALTADELADLRPLAQTVCQALA